MAGEGSAARLFLARRSASAGHGGFWELPGGKLETGESPEAALIREIGEELGVGLDLRGPASSYEAEIGGRGFLFLVFPARFESQAFILTAHDAWGYFSAVECATLQLAPLDGPALRDWAGRPNVTVTEAR
jgi:8-oxo-dGTP diphosphatase